MSFVNTLLRGLFDFLLFPFRTLPPMVGLFLVSLVTAVGVLLVFKATSNQERLATVKRQIQACIFEIRLFNDDLVAILRSQMDVLRYNFTYLRLTAVPTLWIVVPLLLVLAQLQFHYGYRGLEPGQTCLVKVKLRSGWEKIPALAMVDPSGRPRASLEVPSGLAVETPAVWIPSERELDWRIRAEQWGDYEASLRLGGESYTKTVQVRQGVRRRSPVRLESGFLNQLLYPAEDPLPGNGPIESITLGYKDGTVSIFGWHLEWYIAFFGLSILLTFALRKPFKVTI
ncbi:MAG TPA: hypothetical protein VKM54_03430 [Myxococcota bacterium]|nr:hypothetical protein [Myxococcota bacterium]